MSASVRIAVFGNGFARTVILPCLRRVEGAQIVGLASPHAGRLRATAEEFGVPATCADHRELLDRTRPDLVFVTTPPHRHLEMACDALDAGCHVVCEKPMALDRVETERMVAKAATCPGRLALIDHELRFLPARTTLRRLVSGGRIGPILRGDYLLHGSFRRDPSGPWSWWSDAAQGGGALGAIGSHAVDALMLLQGEVSEVRGTLHTFTRERLDPGSGASRPVTSDDFAAAVLRFHSGALSTMTISAIERERIHRLTLTGTTGAVRLDEQKPLLASLDEGARAGAWQEWTGDADLTVPAEPGIPDTDWGQAFLIFARRLVQTILRGEAELPGAATFADGHRTQKVLDAIRLSDKAGSWVPVEGPSRDPS